MSETNCTSRIIEDFRCVMQFFTLLEATKEKEKTWVKTEGNIMLNQGFPNLLALGPTFKNGTLSQPTRQKKNLERKIYLLLNN